MTRTTITKMKAIDTIPIKAHNGIPSRKISLRIFYFFVAVTSPSFFDSSSTIGYGIGSGSSGTGVGSKTCSVGSSTGSSGRY